MLTYSDVKIDSLIVHHVGRRTMQEGVIKSSDLLPVPREQLLRDLLKYFFSSFKEPLYYSFSPIVGELDNNPMYNWIKQIFEDPATLSGVSGEIADFLYDRSTHPNIKSGEFFVAYFHDLLVDDEMLSGLLLCKAETKSSFLKVDSDSQPFSLLSEEGIAVNKVDKACLILDTEPGEGYKMCVIDLSNQREAEFWMNDFLQVTSRNDDYYNTKNYIEMTQSFVKDRMRPLYESDKMEEAEVMSRSQEFFTATESFNDKDYADRVFQRPELTEDFLEYRNDFESERGVSLNPEFDVSPQAVDKQSRVFKSVLKLDKNFHVYIHGNRNMIRRGTDSDGRKFYKIYYENES